MPASLILKIYWNVDINIHEVFFFINTSSAWVHHPALEMSFPPKHMAAIYILSKSWSQQASPVERASHQAPVHRREARPAETSSADVAFPQCTRARQEARSMGPTCCNQHFENYEYPSSSWSKYWIAYYSKLLLENSNICTTLQHSRKSGLWL